MEFKTNKINNKKDLSHKLQSKIKSQMVALGGGLLLLLLMLFLIFKLVMSMDFSTLIFSFGKNLETDDSGKTSILLIGVGGEGHDGPNLTDTVMVASIDYKNKIVPMLSIPRDLYVETKQTGRSRINSVYPYALGKYGKTEGMNVLKETVSKITGLPIQYYVKVDFSGFEKIIDSLGGIDVLVENDIYDTEYPRGETTGYETFSIKAGWQDLDGKTALKYARSRHGRGGGDFDRAKRQQQILYAIKEKALSLNVLTDPNKIQNLYNSISSSIDANISMPEIIELAKISKDFGKEKAVPIVLNDDPTNCGGLVYSPDRSYFDNASVLLPAGTNYDYIHFFVDTIFNNPQNLLSSDKIQVLNGTKTPGLAYEGMALLSRFCLNVIYYSNAETRDLDQTTIYYLPGPKGEKPEILTMISTLIPGAKLEAGLPEVYLQTEKRQPSTIIIELGKDYLKNRLKDPYNNLKYLAAPEQTTSQTQSTTQSTQQNKTK